MADPLTAKLFRTDDGQAVSIPRGFELPGSEVSVRRDGPRLVIEPAPVRTRRLADWLAKQQPVDEEFGPIADPPPEPVDP